MKNKKMREEVKLADIFPGEPPVYGIKRQRLTVSGEAPLLCAEIEYPEFLVAADEGAGLEKLNVFYAGIAERFFDWAETSGRELAEGLYASDTDPRKRFRFSRIRCVASFLPGFCSPGLISVAGSAVVYRGRQPLGGQLLSRLWRPSDGRMLPFGSAGIPRGADIYFSREGWLICRRISGGVISDETAHIDKVYTVSKIISNFFETRSKDVDLRSVL